MALWVARLREIDRDEVVDGAVLRDGDCFHFRHSWRSGAVMKPSSKTMSCCHHMKPCKILVRSDVSISHRWLPCTGYHWRCWRHERVAVTSSPLNLKFLYFGSLYTIYSLIKQVRYGWVCAGNSCPLSAPREQEWGSMSRCHRHDTTMQC